MNWDRNWINFVTILLFPLSILWECFCPDSNIEQHNHQRDYCTAEKRTPPLDLFMHWCIISSSLLWAPECCWPPGVLRWMPAHSLLWDLVPVLYAVQWTVCIQLMLIRSLMCTIESNNQHFFASQNFNKLHCSSSIVIVSSCSSVNWTGIGSCT